MSNYFLERHEAWIKTGKIPDLGLCHSIKKHKTKLKLFEPTWEDRCALVDADLSTGYWGSGLLVSDDNKRTKYTPLRQTIVLFCHEILNS